MSVNLTQEQQVHEVRRLKEAKLTFEQIGQRLGFSERTARRRYAAATIVEAAAELAGEESLTAFPEVEPQEINVASPFLPEDKGIIERFRPLEVYGDAMVTMDWHIPLHDPKLINAMIETARDYDIRQLIIAGDFFHMEQFSSYLPFQEEASLPQERYDGTLAMATVLETFEHVFIGWGNHDFRLSRKLGYKKSFEECFRWMLSDLPENMHERITISDLDYMWYDPQDLLERRYRVCHPRDFSKIPLTVPRKLAEKYSCSVISGHSHHFAIGAAPNGVDLCIEGGGFFSKERTEYIQKSTANHEWVPGYTMFKNGIPRLFSPVLGNV